MLILTKQTYTNPALLTPSLLDQQQSAPKKSINTINRDIILTNCMLRLSMMFF